MTERQWLKADDLRPMLRCLCEQFRLDRDKRGQRKLRLFACGLVRTVKDMVPEATCGKIVAACQDFADGHLHEGQMAEALAEVR